MNEADLLTLRRSPGAVTCLVCGCTHEAVYSHRDPNGQLMFAVRCDEFDVDDLAGLEYYAEEKVE